MKTFKIELQSFYGIDCTGCGHSSEESYEIQVEDSVAEILSAQIEKSGGSLSIDDVLGLINSGHEQLRSLHDQLWKSVVDLDISYWLEQGDADEAGVLVDQMIADPESGEFELKKSYASFNIERCCDPESDGCEEGEAGLELYNLIKEQEYIPWLNTLSPELHAHKNGLDIDAVIEGCEGEYVIYKQDDY